MQLFLKLSIWAQLIMSFSTVYATPILASSISASSSHDTHLKNQHFNGNDNNDSNFDDRKLSNMPQRISEYENRDENENDASENHYEINLYIAEPKVQPEL